MSLGANRKAMSTCAFAILAQCKWTLMPTDVANVLFYVCENPAPDSENNESDAYLCNCRHRTCSPSQGTSSHRAKKHQQLPSQQRETQQAHRYLVDRPYPWQRNICVRLKRYTSDHISVLSLSIAQ